MAEQADPDHRALHAGRFVRHHRAGDQPAFVGGAENHRGRRNRPGANGNTGTDAVAKSAAGGYTLLLCDVGALAISQKTKSDFAVTAIGSAPHLASIAVEKVTGAKWEYIPYKGNSQAATDPIAGQTQVLMNGMLAALPTVQSGKLKVLGVSKATRVPPFAKVPTSTEQGVTGFESGTWQGVLVLAGTPTAIVARLSAERTIENERKRWAGVVAKGASSSNEPSLLLEYSHARTL